MPKVFEGLHKSTDVDVSQLPITDIEYFRLLRKKATDNILLTGNESQESQESQEFCDRCNTSRTRNRNKRLVCECPDE